jgi:type IVB pilus formation R64 PilN family outer membrane protein
MKHNLKFFTVVLLGFGITGCTTFRNITGIDQEVRSEYVKTTQRIAQSQAIPAQTRRDTVVYLKDQWVSQEPIKPKKQVAEPVAKCQIKIATNEPVSILEFGQIVTKYCEIAVRITPDALSAIDNPLTNDDTKSNVTTQPTSAIHPQANNMYPQSASAQMTNNPRLIDVNYNGKLSGLLDMVAARFGLSWKYEDDYIHIYNLDTETFYLKAIAGDTEMHSDVQSGTTMTSGASSDSSTSTTGGSSGGISGQTISNQTTTVTLKTSIWEDIQKTLDSMVSVKGKCVTSPSTGAIVCTDNSTVLGRIRKYVNRENIHLTKQILFQIRIVSVTLTDTDAFGISWNAVYETLSNKYGVKLSSAFSAPQNAITGTFSILQGNSSPWAGTDAILNALSEQGAVSIIKQPTVSTLNLQAIPVQVAKQDGYVSGSQVVATANVGATTTFQTGIITTGFNMSLLPYVMDDNCMLLQFSINLSNLRNIRTVSDGSGGYAEVPELDLPINSSQKVRLNSGETLMLSGFDQEDNSTTYNGVGHPQNFLFGGGANGKRIRNTLVVLITPVIMN